VRRVIFARNIEQAEYECGPLRKSDTVVTPRTDALNKLRGRDPEKYKRVFLWGYDLDWPSGEITHLRNLGWR
jgi:hypothetical protein